MIYHLVMDCCRAFCCVTMPRIVVTRFTIFCMKIKRKGNAIKSSVAINVAAVYTFLFVSFSRSRTTTFDRWKFSNRRFIFEPKARLQKRATWLRRFPNSYDTLETIAGLRESIGIDLGFIEHDRTVPVLERYDYALFDSRWNLMDTSKRNKICGNRYR